MSYAIYPNRQSIGYSKFPNYLDNLRLFICTFILLPIIQREVEQGTIIHRHQWKAYATLNEHGFTHKTVNHSLNFIDPSTGAHTQSIEGLWRIVKEKYGIKVNGVSSLLERQLKEEWWRSLHPAMDTIFDDFLSDMKTTFL